MKKILEEIASRLEEGDTYICWSGVYFDARHKYIRADKLFLNIVSMHKGVPTYRRCLRRIRTGRNKEQFVLFDTSQVMYKITTGSREGKIVTSKELKPKESWAVAGVSKQLIMDKVLGFSENRETDIVSVGLLEKLANNMDNLATVDAASALPELYLTCPARNGSIRLRSSGKSLKYLIKKKGYDDTLTTSQNIAILRGLLSEDAGGGRIAYPYMHFHGVGTVAAAVVGLTRGSIGPWYKVKTLASRVPGMEIKA